MRAHAWLDAAAAGPWPQPRQSALRGTPVAICRARLQRVASAATRLVAFGASQEELHLRHPHQTRRQKGEAHAAPPGGCAGLPIRKLPLRFRPINSQQTRRSDAPIGARCCNSVQRVAIGRAAASVLQCGLLGGFLPRRRRARTLRRPPARKRVALRGARHETGLSKQVPNIVRSDRWPRPVLLLPSAARCKRRDDRAAHGLARRVQDGDGCRLLVPLPSRGGLRASAFAIAGGSP